MVQQYSRTHNAEIVLPSRLGNPVEQFRRLCGDEVTQKLKPIGGLDEEGEINAAWRDTGVHGLWYMFGMQSVYLQSLSRVAYVLFRFSIGNLALCRFHSKHIALRQ